MHKISPSSVNLGDSPILRQDLVGSSQKIQFFSQDAVAHSVVGMYIDANGSQVFLLLGVDEAKIIRDILEARSVFDNGLTPAQALAQ